jgi:NAD(P)-dependent dehydrogenase (short-subunit alcohol dehydrogenase family)
VATDRHRRAEAAVSAPLAGKVAIVTGGSRGIGEAIARRFAADGAAVLITSRHAEQLEEAASRIDGDVVAVASNVGEDGAAERCIEAAVARWGRLDIIVNNAATNPHAGPLDTLTRRQWDKIAEVNIWAPLHWTEVAVSAGLGAAHGSVVNIVSNLAMMSGPPAGAYSTSKAALVHLTKQLAVELGPRVRVNAIAPGVVDTVMATPLISQGAAICSRWPIPRFGRPDDIAAAASFLAGPGGSWITGHVLVADGGASLLTEEVVLGGGSEGPVV